MHNLDRTNPEWGETMESFESQETDRFSFETHGTGEYGETGEFLEMGELGEMNESPFSESEEMELAAELLEITNEAELNHFLGGLIRKVGRTVGKVVRSPIGQALGGVLKKVAKTALPMAGAALGNLVVPGVGGMIGGKLASAAGSMFGLELEGLSAEDREFEVARRYVRLAGATTRRALSAPPRVNPASAASAALRSAARQHAPGLPTAAIVGGSSIASGYPTPYPTPGPGVDGFAGGSVAGSGRSGRWFRRGRRIILLGA
ncbi:MAG TPA: hypothetical protein VLT84_01675 [Acidobacteriota bacterium]|nr:hypothetical protein [Acidobacteriota bacterium]